VARNPPLTSVSVSVSGVNIVRFEDQIPAVEAVFAAVRHDVAFVPFAILPGGSEEMAPASAVDTHNCGLGAMFGHRS
jgi:hypothetical protein